MKYKTNYLSHFAILMMFALSSHTAFSGTNKPILPDKKWDPSIEGIKLGSGYKKVISVLGQPRSKKNNRNNLVLFYDGLTIEVDTTVKKSWWVSRVEVRNSKWNIEPDIHIGMQKHDIKIVLGSFLHQENRETQEWIWWWHGNHKFDSLFAVVFEKNKAVEIIIARDNSI